MCLHGVSKMQRLILDFPYFWSVSCFGDWLIYHMSCWYFFFYQSPLQQRKRTNQFSNTFSPWSVWYNKQYSRQICFSLFYVIQLIWSSSCTLNVKGSTVFFLVFWIYTIFSSFLWCVCIEGTWYHIVWLAFIFL